MNQTMDSQPSDTRDPTWSDFALRVVNGEKITDLFNLDDEFVDIVTAKAHQLYRTGNFEQAKALLLGATALDETRAYGHLLLGDILLNQGEIAAAVERLQVARQLDSDNGFVQAKLGEAYMRAEELQLAHRCLEQAVALLDEDSPHHRRAATLMKVIGQNEQADAASA